MRGSEGNVLPRSDWKRFSPTIVVEEGIGRTVMPLARSFGDTSRSLEGFSHQSGASWVEVLSAEWEEVLEGAGHTSCGEYFNYRLSCGNEVLVDGVCGSLSSKLLWLGSSSPSRVSGKAS